MPPRPGTGAVAALLAVLIGCETVGPRAIRVGRSKYNDAIQMTDKQQMLQNLVRLRYKDVPYFVEVSSVLSAPAFEAAIDGTGSFGDVAVGGVTAGLTYAETPVLVYTPLTGESFTRRLLTPLDFESVALLSNIGWSTERVLRLCVQEINGVENAESGAGPTPKTAPEYEKFNRVIDAFSQSDELGLGTMGMVHEDQEGEPEVHVWFDPASRDAPLLQQLFADLGLDPDQEEYTIVAGVGRGGGDIMAINMRPLIGCMFFMSQGVEVPEKHVRDGRVTITRDDEGRPFDWQNALRGLVRIRSSERPPEDAVVSVQYLDHWFYIANDDLESQETFALLYLLFTLQAGEKPANTPLLSLPIG